MYPCFVVIDQCEHGRRQKVGGDDARRDDPDDAGNGRDAGSKRTLNVHCGCIHDRIWVSGVRSIRGTIELDRQTTRERIHFMHWS